VRALTMKGAVYFVQKKWSEAVRWYEAALKLDPSASEITETLARIKSMSEGGGAGPQSGGRAPAGANKARKSSR